MSENQKEPQYKLRWNEDLRNKVMNSAKANNRSINQEIIVRLEESFNKKTSNANLADLIALQEETIEYMKQLHNQNAELSRELREEKSRNESRFKDLGVLRGLDPVRRRPGMFIDEEGNELSADAHDPSKNYLNINKKKGK